MKGLRREKYPRVMAGKVLRCAQVRAYDDRAKCWNVIFSYRRSICPVVICPYLCTSEVGDLVEAILQHEPPQRLPCGPGGPGNIKALPFVIVIAIILILNISIFIHIIVIIIGILLLLSIVIKAHPWYDGFNWASLSSLEMPPPYLPEVHGVRDYNNNDNDNDDDNYYCNIVVVSLFVQ